MIELEWTVERCNRGDAEAARERPANRVTFVELLASNPTTQARRVRIANRLDGPVWPPRRDGVPESGWDDGGFEGIIPAEETVPLGYTCPAEPTTEPAELLWTERAAATADEPNSGERFATGRPTEAADVVRALGDPRPPRDAVPLPSRETGETKSIDLPDSVSRWLAAVEKRTERAEALANASALPAAAHEVEQVGGLDEVEMLVARLEADAETLATVAERTATLRDRADERAAAVPVDCFERLA